MPPIIIPDELVEERSISSGNLINIIQEENKKFEEKTKHNTNGKPYTIPETVKMAVGLAARSGEAQNRVAEEFDINADSVNKAAKGRTDHLKSGKATVDPEFKQTLDDATENYKKSIAARALDKMFECVDQLDPDKIVKQKDKAEVAVRMSQIVKNLSGERQKGLGVQVVVINPGSRQLRDYDCIDVK